MRLLPYRFAIRIDQGAEDSTLGACTERGLCLLAEAFLRELRRSELWALYVIECQDPRARHRITSYLDGVRPELMCTP